MSLKCRVFRDEKGQIDFVNAENGNRSKLFDNLVNITGGNRNTALNIYALTEVEELKDAMAAKLNAFKERFKNIVKVAPADARFSIVGLKGAQNLDTISGSTVIVDNLEVAIEMERSNETPLKIKIATGWQRGADNQWKYELDSSKASLNLNIDSINKLGKKYSLKSILNYPELFKAYPELNDVKISVSKKGGTTTEGFFDGSQIVLGIESNKLKDFFEAKSKAEEFKKLDPEVIRVVKKFIEIDAYEDSLRDAGMSYSDAYRKAYEKYTREERDADLEILNKFGYANVNKTTYGSDFLTYNDKFSELVRNFKRGSDEALQKSDFNNLNAVLLPVTLHEIQHWIQQKEGFARGSNTVAIYSYLTQEQQNEYKNLSEEKKKAQEKLTKEGKKWYDAPSEIRDIIFAPSDYLYKKYRSAMGEEEARNVEKRLKMTPKERLYSLLQDTEENARENQIFIPQNRTSFNQIESNQKEVLDQVTDRLEQSGLANNVYKMTNAEIEAKLIELGISPETAKSVVAYHGSPYSFDRFTTEKMGTGEGNQAFGWGLYFTDLEDIAKEYATRLAEVQTDYVLRNRFYGSTENISYTDLESFEEFKEIGNNFYKNQIKLLEKEYLDTKDNYYKEALEKVNEEKAVFDNITFNKPSKNIYKVSLQKGKEVGEYNWLEWDKPVSKGVIKTLSEKNKQIAEVLDMWVNEGIIPASVSDKVLDGANLYRYLSGYFEGQKEASLFLLESGIDGIKYPAESIARGATSDTARGFNYVVFDENDVTIDEQIQFSKQLARRDTRLKVIKEALKIEAYTPEVEVANYFLSGGRVSEESIKKLYRNSKGEVKARMSLISKTAPSINQIAQSLWENSEIRDDNGDSTYTDQDYVNFIEELLTNNNTRKSIAEEVLRPYQIENNIPEEDYLYLLSDEYIESQILEREEFERLSYNGVQLTTAGFTYKGDVYLNTDAMRLDTPIHEFGHLHLDWLKENRTDLYQAGLSLIGKNKEEAQQYIDIVKETQPDLEEGSEKFNNEVLAQVIGDQGAKLVNSKKEDSIADWLKSVWESIKDILGLTSYTADEVANMTLADFGTASATEMLSGNRITRNMGENNAYLRYKYDTNQVARERFDIPNLTKISSGSDRVVFDLGEGKVLKVANTARGLAQNMQEGDSDLISKGLLPQVYETGLNYVVVEKLEVLENKAKVPVYDINTGKQYDTEDADVMIQELTPYGQADFDTRNPDLIEVLKSYGLQDFLDYDIIYGDLTNIANWGIKEGKPVHLDAGTFGGMYMIRAYARRKDLSFEDFKKVYEKTQEAKAKFGDTDPNINFSIVSGNKLFNEPLEEASIIADEYMADKKMSTAPIQKITKLDKENSKRIAQEFDKMQATPNDPQTKAAYNAMVEETLEQYEKILSKGYKVEINNLEPYDSSADMISDLRDNKRMKIFSTESGFGDEAITDKQREDNLLLQETKYKDVNGLPLLANDVFRFVHDFFGHAKFGNGFGAIGEENAWNIHARMYSPLARRAMTTETRGQNSWVNFSGVNDEAFKKRDKARVLRQEGKLEEAKKLTEEVYEEMSFAEQKVGLLPEWVSMPKTENITSENSSNYANLTEDGQGNFVFYHVGTSGYEVIKRTSGDTTATSREEAQALAKVGGLAMYYSRPEDSETMIRGESKYMVKIPMDKVYDFNTDSLNLIEKARELHSKEYPGKAFDPNTQVAYVTKVAADFGYEMVVAEWQNRTRAQSIKEHKPNDTQVSEGATVKKPFQENYDSNSSKGYKSIIPVPKNEKLKQLYLDLNNYRNRENRYDSVYSLNENYTKLSQEEISDIINNSDLPQEYKSTYSSIVNSPEGKRMSVLNTPTTPTVTRQPSLELNGTKIFAKDRVNPITGEKLEGVEWELIESTERGQGNARKAAELFLNGTDAQGKDVYLMVSPRDTTTKPERLESFYTSLGFEKTSDFEMVRKARPVSLKDTDSNGEPSIKTLMDFSNSKVKPLGLEGLKAAKNAAMALKVKSSKELVEKMEKALMKNGIVLFDKLSLQRSKLYNIFEINTILSSPKLQKQIKESLLSLRNSEPFELDYDENFIIPQGREVNQFGKQEVTNPSIVEKDLVESVAGLEESEIDEALPTTFSNKYYTDPNFKETVDSIARDHKKAPIKTVVDGELVDKTEDVEGMLLNTMTDDLDISITEDIAFLRQGIDKEIFNSDLKNVSKVLNKIKKNVQVNGIDLRNFPTLALELSRDEVLGFLDSMEDVIEDPSNPENMIEFTERYYKILGDKEAKTEVIKTNSENDVVVEEPLSEYEMFSEFGLIKKDDGIYRKVKEQSLDSLYESFFEYKNLLPEGIDTLEALKLYVERNASLLEVSDYEVDVDNLEKIFLYKKFFDFPMSTQRPTVKVDNFNKITNSEEYLTDEFLKDFNKWILTTSNPYFKVTGKGIELVNSDEMSKSEAVDSVPERFKQELAEYNIISDSLNLEMPLLEEKPEDINTQLEQRQKAVNNPDRVKKVSGQYTYLKDGVLAVKNESETFVKTPIGVFEKIFEFENIKFYGKLDTDKRTGYKKVNVEAPFSDISFQEYMYLANAPEAFKTSKNYYSKKELDDINEEYFGCQ